MHRRAEDAEHPLMGAHVGELIRHVIFHQKMLAGQFQNFRALFGGRSRIKQCFQLGPAAKLRAELPPLGQKAALTAAERRTGGQAAGIFDLCVFAAGDFFVHAGSSGIPIHTKRTPAYFYARAS